MKILKLYSVIKQYLLYLISLFAMNKLQDLSLPSDITELREKQLFEQLTAFAHTAQIPVSFYNNHFECIWECLPDRKLCSIFPSLNACSPTCLACLSRAHRASLSIEDPFIFLCDSALVHITYPFIVDHAVKGSFFIGPIIMGLNRHNAIKRFTKNLSCQKDYLPEVLIYLEKTQVKTPVEVSYLYDVFCNSIFSYRLEEKGNMSLNRRILQSSSSLTEPDDLYYTSLLLAVKSGNGETATASFRIYYEKIYLSSLGNLNRIRFQLLELFSNLSTAVMSEFFLVSDFHMLLEAIKTAITLADLYHLAEQLIFRISSNCVPSIYGGNSEIIKNALTYLHENFNQDLTLKKMAEDISVNQSYLSSLLKRETGFTFSQHLNSIRLNESLKLLTDTHFSITEISMICGFSNQSYYIKTFKEHFHKTPGSYRREHLKGQLLHTTQKKKGMD